MNPDFSSIIRPIIEKAAWAADERMDMVIEKTAENFAEKWNSFLLLNPDKDKKNSFLNHLKQLAEGVGTRWRGILECDTNIVFRGQTIEEVAEKKIERLINSLNA